MAVSRISGSALSAPVALFAQIAGFVAIIAADAMGYVPLTQTLFHLPFVWLAMWWMSSKWAEIGWRLPVSIVRTIAVGVVLGVAMELFAVLVTTPLISGMFGVEPDYSDLADIRGNLPLLFIFLALSWTLAAFGEEVCFRGFLQNRLETLFGGQGRFQTYLALFVGSLVFGLGHTEQGVSGWIQEGLSGFLLGLMFILSGRSLALPITAHGVSNTLAFVLIYLGKYPGLPPT